MTTDTGPSSSRWSPLDLISNSGSHEPYEIRIYPLYLADLPSHLSIGRGTSFVVLGQALIDIDRALPGK